MTSTITEVILVLLDNHPLATTLDLVAIMLLITLLVTREMIRACGGHRAQVWIEALNVAIIPLVLVFGLIVTARLGSMVGR